MVTSQISGFGFTATAPTSTATPTAGSGAFLQALQGEISQAASVTAAQSDEAMTFTPEFFEKLMNFVKKLLDEQCGDNTDLAQQIIEELMKKLKGEDEKDEEKTALQNDETKTGEPKKDINVGMRDVPDSILELIKAMLECIREELKQQNTELNAKNDISIIASVGKITIDSSENGSVTEFIPDIAVVTDAQTNQDASAQENPISDGSDAKPQQVTHVIQQNPEEIGQHISFEVKEPLAAEITTVQTTATASQEQTAASNASPTMQTDFASAQSSAQSISEIADEILMQILDFAKDELGLSDVQISVSQPASTSATQQTVFFAIPNLLRTQSETQDELSQLIENAKTENMVQASNEHQITTDENSQTKTETSDAVKKPTELLENVQQSAPQISVQTAAQEAHEVPVHTQISQRVIEAVATMNTERSGETTFKMTLNPESLGQIEVKIVTADGKVTVEIATQSRQTQSILAERLDGLQTALKQNGVELEKYQVIYAPEQTQSDSRSYEGSSKNPYSRRQSEKNEQNDESVKFSELLKAL